MKPSRIQKVGSMKVTNIIPVRFEIILDEKYKIDLELLAKKLKSSLEYTLENLSDDLESYLDLQELDDLVIKCKIGEDVYD